MSIIIVVFILLFFPGGYKFCNIFHEKLVVYVFHLEGYISMANTKKEVKVKRKFLFVDYTESDRYIFRDVFIRKSNAHCLHIPFSIFQQSKHSVVDTVAANRATIDTTSCYFNGKDNERNGKSTSMKKLVRNTINKLI